jgi:hypothetical protein
MTFSEGNVISALKAIFEHYLGDEPISIELPSNAIDISTFPEKVNGREFTSRLSGATVTVEARLRGAESVFLLSPMYWFRGFIFADESGRTKLVGSVSLIPMVRWFAFSYLFVMLGIAILGTILFAITLFVVGWSDKTGEALVLVGMSGVCLLFGKFIVLGNKFLFSTVRRDLKSFIRSIETAGPESP